MTKKKSNKIDPIKKEKLKKLFKFFGIFFGIIIVYYLIILITSNEIFNSYINFSASCAGYILNIFDGKSEVIGNIIKYKQFDTQLSFGCEGTEPLVIFLAGVLAFPAGIKDKLWGILIGIITLYLLNIIRIVLLILIGSSSPDLFETFHTEIFPVLFIMISLMAWLIWVKLSESKKIQSNKMS